MTGGWGVTGKIQQSVVPLTEDIFLQAEGLFCRFSIQDFQPIGPYTRQDMLRLIYSAFSCPSGNLPVNPPTHFNHLRQAKKRRFCQKEFYLGKPDWNCSCGTQKMFNAPAVPVTNQNSLIWQAPVIPVIKQEGF